MTDRVDKRRGPDRRRQPRGGRRPGDVEGFAPLVLLVGEGRHIAAGAEAILAKLKFAVATSPTTDEALRVLPDLRPGLIVVGEEEAEVIRAAAGVPVVIARPATDETPEQLTERILRTLRSAAV